MYGLIQRPAYSHDSRIQIKSFSQKQNAFLKDVNNRIIIEVRNYFFQSIRTSSIPGIDPLLYDLALEVGHSYVCKLVTKRVTQVGQNF